MKTPDVLFEALRQYRHNIGDDTLVVGFDHDVAAKVVERLLRDRSRATAAYRNRAIECDRLECEVERLNKVVKGEKAKLESIFHTVMNWYT